MAMGYYYTGFEKGIELIDFIYGIEDYVTWKWLNEKKIHKSQIYSTSSGERLFFRARQYGRIYLDECLRAGL